MFDLKTARLKANITQKTMSELFDIPLRTIENWEGGVSTPPKYVQGLILDKLLQIQNESEDKYEQE